MRRFAHRLLLAGIALQLAATARTAAGQVPTATPSDRARLLSLEDDWARALVRRDRSVFQRMLAPGFVYTEDDRLSTREEVLRDIIAPGDTVSSAHNEGMAPHLSLGTGVVTGILVIEGHANGAAYVHRYRFTDTWLKQSDGSWRIFAAQDYLVPHR